MLKKKKKNAKKTNFAIFLLGVDMRILCAHQVIVSRWEGRALDGSGGGEEREEKRTWRKRGRGERGEEGGIEGHGEEGKDTGRDKE